MAQHAAVYTPELVAEFLRSVGLGQYTESFIENDISGEMLLEAEDDDWTELGVNSHLHRVKISVLFKRLLLGATARLGSAGWAKYISITFQCVCMYFKLATSVQYSNCFGADERR